MTEKIKLLIIDDGENECKTLKNILDAKGYQVFTAHNAFEALASVKETCPDLILLDLVLKGGETGVGVFQDIQKIIPGVKAILITGYGAEEEHKLLAEAWNEKGIVDEFLRKPLWPDELIKAIEKHIKGKKDV